MSQEDDYFPDEPLGTETFEQGDEAQDEDTRLDPDFVEDLEQDPSINPTLLVDDREMEEAGVQFDDPEKLATLDGGMDDPDGSAARRGTPPTTAEDEEGDGWDLAAAETSDDDEGDDDDLA
ncbi:MAG TPA: hypothetical protein VG298_09820 [Acidimicrobiales bacterium]|nr:hypothetical protein [Acidimicrobiales bacterium]